MTLADVHLREAREARDRMLERQRELEHARADYHHAIRRLSADGASTREIAEALGLSHQRVHQIVCEDASSRDRVRSLVQLFPRRSRGSFTRFTEAARQVVVDAQAEAEALGHAYIGAEHLLLALLGARDDAPARALATLGLTREGVRADVLRRVGRGEASVVAGRVPFTPAAKKALELALREALALKDDFIGAEHILLALVGEQDSLAFEILAASGADAERVRRAVLRLRAA